MTTCDFRVYIGLSMQLYGYEENLGSSMSEATVGNTVYWYSMLYQ